MGSIRVYTVIEGEGDSHFEVEFNIIITVVTLLMKTEEIFSF